MTYDYSEQIPLILRANVAPAEKFVMLETLTFNWRERTLEVEVHNETGLPDVSYREVTMIAATTVPVDADGAEKIMGLVDALEDLDDVQNVYTNIDIPDEVLASL